MSSKRRFLAEAPRGKGERSQRALTAKKPLPYSKFRTGLTFKAVRHLLLMDQQVARAKGEYMFVRRRTVLGRFKELKQQAYMRYLQQFEDDRDLPF